MAKRNIQPAMPETDLIEIPDIVDSESLAAMRRKLDIEDDSEVTVHCYKQDAETKEDAKIWEGDGTAAFDLGALVRVFGSGRYRVRIYARDASGSKPLRYNRAVFWQLPPEGDALVNAAKARALNPPVDDKPHNGADMQAMMQTMLAGFEATLARVLPARIEQPDPFTQLQKLGELMKAMQPAPAVMAGPGFMEVLNMVKTFNDVTGANKSVPADASVTDTLLLEAARALMPAIATGVQKQAADQQVKVQDTPAISGPQLSEEDQEKIMFLQLKLKAANRAAAKGTSAVEYAEDIYEAFDETDIHGFALDPNWFKFLVEAVPDCATHEEWYKAVRLALIDIAIEESLLLCDEAGNLTVAPVGDSVSESSQEKLNGFADGDTGAQGTKLSS